MLFLPSYWKVSLEFLRDFSHVSVFWMNFPATESSNVVLQSVSAQGDKLTKLGNDQLEVKHVDL